MRNAKTKKEKTKVLERHEREQQKELEKIEKERESIGRRKDGKFRTWTKADLDQFQSSLQRTSVVKDKLQMLRKWLKKLGKKKTKKTGKLI
jgi:hypothetical protein